MSVRKRIEKVADLVKEAFFRIKKQETREAPLGVGVWVDEKERKVYVVETEYHEIGEGEIAGLPERWLSEGSELVALFVNGEDMPEEELKDRATLWLMYLAETEREGRLRKALLRGGYQIRG